MGSANFTGADLDRATFYRDTVLPDGENWATGADTARFTDADNPNYWQPTWAKNAGG